MKVLMSSFSEGNPNQRILKERLEKRGIEVAVDDKPKPYSPLLETIKSDVDIVHLNWIHSYFLTLDRSLLKALASFPIYFFQLLILRLLGKRIVWTAHNLCNHERIYPRIDRIMGVITANLAHKVQVWDERTQEEICQHFFISKEKTHIIPYGNYLPVYSDAGVDKEQARAKLDITADKRTILFFGQIRPYKQVPKLIDKFKQVADQEKHALLIAGNPANEEIESEIREKADADNIITDLRFIPEESVPTYFAASDWTIFPYKHIFNSGSIFLSMSLRRPFIAPDMGCIPTYTPEGNIIYSELTEGIGEALNSDEERIEATGKRNHEFMQELDWETLTDKIVTLYR